jgi:hypothetical protein
MIELIENIQKFPEDIINDVKLGKIHVVCMAQNGLTHLNVYAELYLEIPKSIVNQCVDLVNSKKETGTLFPHAYISLLPKSENKSDWNKNPQILNIKEMETCIGDVFITNQKYLKSEIIFFSLESGYIRKTIALEIIKNIIAKEKFNELYVKTIWVL